MTAPSKSWTNIADTQIDADSPIDTTLMTALRDNEIHTRECVYDPALHTAAKAHNHDGVNSAVVAMADDSITGLKFNRSSSFSYFDDFIANDFAAKYVIPNGGVTKNGNHQLRITGTASGTYFGWYTDSAGFSPTGGATIIYEAKVRASISAGQFDSAVYAGFLADWTAPGFTAGAAFYTVGNSGALNVLTCAGGAHTYTALGVNLGTNGQVLKVVANASSAQFYVDGVLKATHTTNLPAGPLNFGVLDIAGTALNKTVDTDWVFAHSDTRLAM